MSQVRENGEKLSIATIVLIFLIFILSSLISSDYKIPLYKGFYDIVVSLETFHFSGEFGFVLLLLSLFIGAFVVYLFEFLVSLIRSEFGGALYMAQRLRLKNHFIICGGGRIGERIAHILTERHLPALIIENDEQRAFELKKLGFKVLKENALEEKTFKLANIKKAKAVFACLGNDVDNFMVVLNAKEGNPNIKIITRCNTIKNVNKFKQLGASEVVLPEIVGADRMVYLSEKK